MTNLELVDGRVRQRQTAPPLHRTFDFLLWNRFEVVSAEPFPVLWDDGEEIVFEFGAVGDAITHAILWDRSTMRVMGAPYGDAEGVYKKRPGTWEVLTMRMESKFRPTSLLLWQLTDNGEGVRKSLRNQGVLASVKVDGKEQLAGGASVFGIALAVFDDSRKWVALWRWVPSEIDEEDCDDEV